MSKIGLKRGVGEDVSCLPGPTTNLRIRHSEEYWRNSLHCWTSKEPARAEEGPCRFHPVNAFVQKSITISLPSYLYLSLAFAHVHAIVTFQPFDPVFNLNIPSSPFLLPPSETEQPGQRPIKFTMQQKSRTDHAERTDDLKVSFDMDRVVRDARVATEKEHKMTLLQGLKL